MSLIFAFLAVMWFCVYHLICRFMECERKPELPQRHSERPANPIDDLHGRSQCTIVAQHLSNLNKKKNVIVKYYQYISHMRLFSCLHRTFSLFSLCTLLKRRNSELHTTPDTKTICTLLVVWTTQQQLMATDQMMQDSRLQSQQC